jgi:hypothetical protein
MLKPGEKQLKFESFLRDDFVRSSLVVVYNEVSLGVAQVTLNHIKYGIMELKPDYKDVHRWENEEEAQEASFLNRHFTTILLDGVVDNLSFEQDLILAVEEDLRSAKPGAEQGLLLDLLDEIKKGKFPENLPFQPGKSISELTYDI